MRKTVKHGVAMNKYEKNNYQSDERSTQEGIMIPARYVGLCGASIVMILASVFMGGYFWGKKQALETFCKSTDRDSLADQIFVALCGAADSKDSHQSTNNDDLDEVIEEQETTVLVAGDSQSPDQVTVANQSNDQSAQAESAHPISSEKTCHSPDSQKAPHYAELIGFGSLQGAKRFAQRIREKNHLNVSVKKRISKTVKGRTVTWYQVVTEPYANEQELISLVNVVKQQERLNDVRIVNCCG